VKVLVLFEQTFYHRKSEIDFVVRARETIGKMFIVSSQRDFLAQYEAFNEIPGYIVDTLPIGIELFAGKKTMILYLPENGKRLA